MMNGILFVLFLLGPIFYDFISTSSSADGFANA